MEPYWAWVFIIGAFLVVEGIGLRSTKDNWPTFTDLVRKVPKWMTAAFMGWLVFHFLIER